MHGRIGAVLLQRFGELCSAAELFFQGLEELEEIQILRGEAAFQLQPFPGAVVCGPEHDGQQRLFVFFQDKIPPERAGNVAVPVAQEGVQIDGSRADGNVAQCQAKLEGPGHRRSQQHQLLERRQLATLLRRAGIEGSAEFFQHFQRRAGRRFILLIAAAHLGEQAG